jgi:peptide/nickel transport system ATP-binding protein
MRQTSGTSDALEIGNLSVSIGGTPILRGVDLALEQGKILGLVGESGGGKTMVCKAVLGILPESARVTSGSIRFEGRELLAMAPKERRSLLGRSIAMILQNPMTALNPAFRIEDQVTDVLLLHAGLDRAQARARALELLAAVHIREPERVLRLYPHELSGGMCQRVVISIAFSCSPRLIIADEPTTALDVTVQHQILRLIRDLQRKTGTSVLFITHDLGVVAKICDSVSVIYAGRILESGPVERIFSTQHHPYTEALLNAAPRYDRPESALLPISPELRERLAREAEAYDSEAARA